MVIAGRGDMDELQILGAVHLRLADLADRGQDVVGVLKIALFAVFHGVQEPEVQLLRAKFRNQGLHSLRREFFTIKNYVRPRFSFLSFCFFSVLYNDLLFPDS